MTKHNLSLFSHPLLNSLKPSEIQLLIENATQVTQKKGIYLKKSNTSCGLLYLLMNGYVKRGRYSESGKEFNSKIFVPQEYFGDMAFYNDEFDKPYFYKSITPVTIFTIKLKYIDIILKQNNSFSNLLYSESIKNVAKLEKNHFNLVFNNIEGRLAFFLLQLAEDFGRNIGDEVLIEHPLTQQDMANFIGLTRQTINQALVIFKEKGYIYIPDRKKILLKNIKQIETIAMY